MSQDDKEMKSCPFCGSFILHQYLDGNNPGNDFWITCAECDSSSAMKNNKQDAIKAWNTRKSPSSGLENLDEEEVVEYLHKVAPENESFKLNFIGYKLCSKFGQPKALSVEEISKVLEEHGVVNKWLAQALKNAMEGKNA